ncbi:WD40 repeat protein [Vibrio cholerae LMA3984-4]|nr:WD40 repeat protein [Vibrio cholerae LMA3984-4]
MLSGCFFTHQAEQQWDLAPEGSTAFGLSRDGRFALIYSKQQQLVLWDLLQDKKLADLGAQDPQANPVSVIRIADSERFAVTASQNNFAVWDLAWTQGKGLWSITDGLIRDVDLSSDGEQVLLGLTNGKAIYVDLVSGRRMEFLAHREKVNSVALSANGRYALTGGNDYHAYLWDTKTGQINLNMSSESIGSLYNEKVNWRLLQMVAIKRSFGISPQTASPSSYRVFDAN